MYSGGGESVHLKLFAQPHESVLSLDIKVDGSSAAVAAGGSQPADLTFDWQRPNRITVNGKFTGDAETQLLYREPGKQWAFFEWLKSREPRSGGTDGSFLWHPSEGRNKPRVLESGKPMEYKIKFQLGDGSGRALNLQGLHPGNCVFSLAR